MFEPFCLQSGPKSVELNFWARQVQPQLTWVPPWLPFGVSFWAAGSIPTWTLVCIISISWKQPHYSVGVSLFCSLPRAWGFPAQAPKELQQGSSRAPVLSPAAPKLRISGICGIRKLEKKVGNWIPSYPLTIFIILPCFRAYTWTLVSSFFFLFFLKAG